VKRRSIRRLAAVIPTLPLAQVRGGNTVPCVGVYGVQPCVALGPDLTQKK
jgi:hypothetical protein